MKKTRRALKLNRITVALPAHQSAAHSLELIATLASRSQAEVSCFFIEDADMVGAAGLPFAMEVCRATNVVRPIDAKEIERGLKERATATRKLVAETAARTGTRWSFEVMRERMSRALLELTKQTDVIMLAAATSTDISSLWNKFAARNAKSSSLPGESIVVVVENSSASDRALELASRLSEIHQLPIHALVATDSELGRKQINAQLLRINNIGVAHTHHLPGMAFDNVIQTAQALHPASLLIPLTLVENSTVRIQTLEEIVQGPILIVK